jgi:hypothetical protein
MSAFDGFVEQHIVALCASVFAAIIRARRPPGLSPAATALQATFACVIFRTIDRACSYSLTPV